MFLKNTSAHVHSSFSIPIHIYIDGLQDIEYVYQERNFDMDRIRTFAKRAQGELPLPIPQATLHQPSEEHLDGLTARPFWDTTSLDMSNDFPWAKKLEEHSSIILQELQEKLKREEDNKSNHIFTGDSAWQNKVMGGGWSAFRLQRLGEWNVENCKEFPKTFELLQSLNIPFAVRGVCFARQAAGSGVQPHSDGRNFILTSHLGLIVPEGCWIKVGDETSTWENGKLITIDTSFEHSTGNPTDSDRYVLIIDFWHPETTEAERAALDFIYNLRNKYESGKIPFRKPRRILEEEEGQGLKGMLNSFFSKK